MDPIVIATLAAIGLFVGALAAYLVVIAVTLWQVRSNAQRILDELEGVARAASPLGDLVEGLASSVDAHARTTVGVETERAAGTGGKER